MQYILNLDGRASSGGSALVTHNERLADPLDPFVEAIGKISSKRKKTRAEHLEIARLEFYGGLYTTPELESPDNINGGVPCIPAWNLLRCLQDGARRTKRGMDVPRGVTPLVDAAPIEYQGPDDVQELWKDGTFALRKSVGIQRSRTMRTRPMFTDWQIKLPVEVDANVFDRHTLENIWADAGTYAGIGEMRPVYGRFIATVEETK